MEMEICDHASRPSNETFIAVVVTQMTVLSLWNLCGARANSGSPQIITLSLRFIRLWLSCYPFNPPCECVYFTVVPAAPSSCNITLSYSQLSGKLLFIDTTWNTVSVSHIELPSNCMLIRLIILMRSIVYTVVSRKSTHPRKGAHPLLLAQFSV